MEHQNKSSFDRVPAFSVSSPMDSGGEQPRERSQERGKNTWLDFRQNTVQSIRQRLGFDSETDGKGKLNSAARFLLRGGFVSLYAALLCGGGYPFGTSPLGIGLLGSIGRQIPFAYLGILLASVRSRATVTVLLRATTVLVLRVAIGVFSSDAEGNRIRLFSESLLYRMATVGVTDLLFGMVRIAAGGFSLQDAYGAMIDLFGSVASVWLFGGVTCKKSAGRFSVRYEVGVLSLLTGGIFALRSVSLGGFSFALPLAFFVTLYASRAGGALRGCLFGMLCGLACGMVYAPILGLAGIVCGLFWNYSKSIAVSVSAVGSILFGVVLNGWRSLPITAPQYLIASMLFLPLAQFDLLPKIRLFGEVKEAVPAAVGEGTARKTALQLQALSSALESLSDVFYHLSDRLRKPAGYAVRKQCEQEFASHCASCPLCSRCRDGEAERLAQAVEDLSRQLTKEGKLSIETLPSWMQSGCPRSAMIVSSLNLSVADLREELRLRDKTKIVAMDYEAMAHLVENAAREDPDTVFDEDGSDRVLKTADLLDLRIDTAAVYGVRRRTLILGGVDITGFRMGAQEIRDRLGEVCDTRFGTPTFQMNRNGGEEYVSMTMTSTRRFSVQSACASRTEPNETVSGDHMLAFENNDDYFYTMLSDGMGSGREAALTSRVCGVFMQKMLQASAKKDVALRMLNGVIRTKEMECFATVDLLEIDLITGRAGFIKGGAAPSYVLRNGNLYKISSATMPIGITKEMNAEEIRFDLQEGDVVVMVSDGIAQSFEDGIWLVNLLGAGCDDNLDEMAEKILREAQKNNKRTDDMTVGLIRMVAA